MKYRHMTQPLPGLTVEEREALFRLLNGDEGTTNQRGGIRRILTNLVRPAPLSVPCSVVFKRLEAQTVTLRAQTEAQAKLKIQLSL